MNKKICCVLLAAGFVACSKPDVDPRPLPPLPSDPRAAKKGAAESDPHAGVPRPTPPPQNKSSDTSRVIDVPDGIKFIIPEKWTKLQPKSSMRVAELQAPVAEGSPTAPGLIVFFFKGGAGDFDSNVDRWTKQLTNADGTAIGEKQKLVQEISVGGLPVRTFEATGNYTETNPQTMQPTSTIQNAKMIVAMIETERGAFFFKFTGPKAAVDAASADYHNMIKSIVVKD